MKKTYYYLHRGIMGTELIKVKELRQRKSNTPQTLYVTESGKELVIDEFNLYDSKFQYKWKNYYKPYIVDLIYDYIPRKFQAPFLRMFR